MFSESSIVNNVNIVNKVICFLLIICGLILCREGLVLFFINLFLLLITKNMLKLFKTNIVVTLFVVLSMFIPQFLWISKIGLLLIYFLLLKNVTKVNELRYVLENTLYHFQSKKITYKILYFLYFIKYFNINVKKLFLLKDEYSVSLSIKYIYFIMKQSFIKTKSEMKEFIMINDIRFYNYSKNRTYIEKIKWESWDTTYIISHIIILGIMIMYGGYYAL